MLAGVCHAQSNRINYLSASAFIRNNFREFWSDLIFETFASVLCRSASILFGLVRAGHGYIESARGTQEFSFLLEIIKRLSGYLYIYILE